MLYKTTLLLIIFHLPPLHNSRAPVTSVTLAWQGKFLKVLLYSAVSSLQSSELLKAVYFPGKQTYSIKYHLNIFWEASSYN